MRQTRDKYRSNRGFSLLEIIIATVLSLVVLSGALVLTNQAVRLSDMVTQRSDMQQNARVAMNVMARDLSLAGTGFPRGGIQLPTGTDSDDSFFACDLVDCYVTNQVFTGERLFAITPGDGKGPSINGVDTDVVTLVYKDTRSNFDQYALVQVADFSNVYAAFIELDPQTTPAYDDAVVGVKVGDVLVMCNVNGCAVGTVTAFLVVSLTQAAVYMGDVATPITVKDPLQFNQPDAAIGNKMAILSPPVAPSFPPTTAYRVDVITYYIDASDPDSPLLMRQVNAHPPTPMAENIENLQITYDTFDLDASVATANLTGAEMSFTPNQIRKVNISLTATSPRETILGTRTVQRMPLTTSVGPRNLIYRDRYE